MTDAQEGSESDGIALRVVFDERVPKPSLRALSAAIFDMNLVYELGVILSDADYDNYRFSPMRFWRRDGRPIRREHLALVVQVEHRSPLSLLLLVPGAVVTASGGLWALWQLFERVIDRPLNRQLLEMRCGESFTRRRRPVSTIERRSTSKSR
jgi:hypothetical protein